MADPFLANGAIRHGLKLICIGRPGLGASTPVARLSHDGVAADVAEFVDATGLSRFHIYGSGTASHFAFAAAKRFGGRVDRIALHAPRFGMPDASNKTALAQFWFQAAQNSWMLATVAALFDKTRLSQGLIWIMSKLSSVGPQDDAQSNAHGLAAYEVAQTRDALSNGLHGAVTELRLYISGARENAGSIRRPIRAYAGALNATLAHEDYEAIAAAHSHFEIVRFPDTGIQYSEAQADEMMRWLARGD